MLCRAISGNQEAAGKEKGNFPLETGAGRGNLIWGLLFCSLPESPETIELEVRTNSAEGLLFWQGVVSGQETAELGGAGGSLAAPWESSVSDARRICAGSLLKSSPSDDRLWANWARSRPLGAARSIRTEESCPEGRRLDGREGPPPPPAELRNAPECLAVSCMSAWWRLQTLRRLVLSEPVARLAGLVDTHGFCLSLSLSRPRESPAPSSMLLARY